MWRLAITLLFYNLFLPPKDIILVIDDCKKWNEIKLNPIDGRYSIFKEISKFHHTTLSHNWMNPEDKLATIHLTYQEMLNYQPIFSSDLSSEDWYDLMSKTRTRKMFILKPNDFCSNKRFIFGEKFELLEVRISLGGDE
jgi:hypothetical protein